MAGTLIANDLRRTGTEAKRAHNHKAKWAYGGRSAQARREPSEAFPVTRPAMPLSHSMNFQRLMQNDRKAKTNQLVTSAKIDLRRDIREALDSGSSDSSSGEDIDDPASAPRIVEHFPEDDNSVVGQTILCDAVNKAVEKFETRETEKLVKEYEIVSYENEAALGYLADDDFELVDRVKL